MDSNKQHKINSRLLEATRDVKFLSAAVSWHGVESQEHREKQQNNCCSIYMLNIVYLKIISSEFQLRLLEGKQVGVVKTEWKLHMTSGAP